MNIKPIIKITAILLVSQITACVSLVGPVAIGTETGTSKMGKACFKHFLGSVKGDGSIDAAKRNGRITTVSTVDISIDSTWFIKSEVCTVVRGE